MRANLLWTGLHWDLSLAEITVAQMERQRVDLMAGHLSMKRGARWVLSLSKKKAGCLVMQKVARSKTNLAEEMAPTEDAQANLGLHLAVMSASLKLKDALESAHSACWKLEDS